MTQIAKQKSLQVQCSEQIFNRENNIFRGIYMILNTQNGESYIGRSNNILRRFAEHKSKSSFLNTKVAKSIKKYSIDQFDFDVLELVDCNKEIIEKERLWISKLKPFYNMNKGGHGNSMKVDEKTKKILSKKNKEYWKSLPEEKKSIIINRLTGPKVGHKVSEQTRLKLRNINLGKKQSKETCLKRSKSLKGKVRQNKHRYLKVYCINLDGNKEYFDSIKEAGQKKGVNNTSICKALKGVQKTAGKLIWKYNY